MKKANSNVSFRINKKGKLYFLNSVSFHKAHTLEILHKILGHCNVRDILKLERNVEGMTISSRDDFDCKTCYEGKMHKSRNVL